MVVEVFLLNCFFFHLDETGVDVVGLGVVCDHDPGVVVGLDVSPPVQTPVVRMLGGAGPKLKFHLRAITHDSYLLKIIMTKSKYIV